jgi:superfamily II DNA/RNA helicase
MQSFTNQKSPYTNSINTNNFELRKPIFYNSQKNPNEIPPQPQQPQQNKFRTFKENPNVTEWYYRYGRPGFIRSSILEEDEVLFKEHNENLKQKQRFDFDNLSHETIKIFYQEEEISTNHNNDNITINDSFHKLNIDKQIMNNLIKMQYDLMTPIQKYIIPYVLNKKDCLGCAQTGSGKTIAFLVPIVSLMLKEGCPKEKMQYNYCSYPVCLIIVPTRELAEQIYKEARKVIHKTGIIVTKVYGGVPCDSQIRELKQGSDIVIGTPGRLLEHIERRYLNLSMIQYLVIDESDRMLDMGFEDQMKSIVFNNQMTDKTKRNNLMFSATIPQNVLSISNKFMNESYLITSSNKDDIGNANSNVTQIIEYVEDNDKILKLHEIFQQIQGNAILFMETKKSVDSLESFLEKRNYNVVAIHGDKPQTLRQEAIKLFSSGEVPILIATDVASRGLDFPNVSYVFNFDMPKNIEDYIHRIGRTGRVGNKGTAISFFNSKNASIASELVNILNKMNQEVPEFLYQYYDEKKSFSNNGNNGYYHNKKKGGYNGRRGGNRGRGGMRGRGNYGNYNNRKGGNNNGEQEQFWKGFY